MDAGGVVALVFGVTGTVLSLGALVWQAWSYINSGPVVKVQAAWGCRMGDGVIQLPLDQPPTMQNMQRLQDMGATGESVWVVTVANLGRTPTSIAEVGADYSGASLNFTRSQPGEAPLPHRLEPHAAQSWTLPLTSVMAGLESFKAAGVKVHGIRAYALTPAKRIYSKDRLI